MKRTTRPVRSPKRFANARTSLARGPSLPSMFNGNPTTNSPSDPNNSDTPAAIASSNCSPPRDAIGTSINPAGDAIPDPLSPSASPVR